MAGAARHTLDGAAVTLTVAQLIALFDAREVWRPMPGFPYEVSSWGRVRRRGCVVALRPGVTRGYAAVCLSVNGKKTMARVNRLVAMAFLGPPPFAGAEAMHGDGNKNNNRVANIRWGTPLDNIDDQVRHGTRVVGSRRSDAKLSEADIPIIDKMILQGSTYRNCANRFGVERSVVYYAHKRITWKHVPRERIAA